MAIPAHELDRLLRESFPDAVITLEDLAGDADHFALRIVSGVFSGESRIKRHQRVYAALGGRVGGELHALSITALSPEEDGRSA